MKTLTESIVNELRLSTVKTGNKLKYKTFDELKEGDKLYFVNNLVETIEEATYTALDFKWGVWGFSKLYSNLNPDQLKELRLDIKIDTTTASGYKMPFRAPSNVTYVVDKDHSAVCATSEELLLELIEKYNIKTPLK